MPVEVRHNSCRCAVWRKQKLSPRISYNVVTCNFTFSGPLDYWVQTFETRIPLKPEFGGERDVAFSSISHEQSQSD